MTLAEVQSLISKNLINDPRVEAISFYGIEGKIELVNGEAFQILVSRFSKEDLQ